MTIYLSIIKRPLKNGKCNIVFDVVNGREFRKKLNTGLTVHPNDWDNTNRRVKNKANNSGLLNSKVRKLNRMIENALDYFHNGDFSLTQVISYLQGKSDFESIDDYIETEIKNTRKQPTYRDYKNTVNAIKLHLNYGEKQKLLFEDINYKLLNTFKINSEKNGVRGTSYNSYLKKLKAILNDAYDKGFLFKKIEFKNSLKRNDNQRLKIKTCTSVEFENSIDKIKDIYDAQALGLYLLMFSCRGMYPADIVSFKSVNFEHATKDNAYEMFYETGYDYLIHRRSKTRGRNNAEMYIRIDDGGNLGLFRMLKFSFIYTHYKSKPQIIPPMMEGVGILNYSVDEDYRLHKNVWDIYSKRIHKLLGYSFKTARKTFNTYALELEVSDTIRRILLGHTDSSELRSYDNLQTEKIRKQVEQAHIDVLRDFRFDELFLKLRTKMESINIPEIIYWDGFFPDEHDTPEDFYNYYFTSEK